MIHDDPIFPPATRLLFDKPVNPKTTAYFYDTPMSAESFVAHLRVALAEFANEMARHAESGDHYQLLRAKYVEQWVELFLRRMEVEHAPEVTKRPLRLKDGDDIYRELVIGADQDSAEPPVATGLVAELGRNSV